MKKSQIRSLEEIVYAVLGVKIKTVLTEALGKDIEINQYERGYRILPIGAPRYDFYISEYVDEQIVQEYVNILAGEINGFSGTSSGSLVKSIDYKYIYFNDKGQKLATINGKIKFTPSEFEISLIQDYWRLMAVPQLA